MNGGRLNWNWHVEIIEICSPTRVCFVEGVVGRQYVPATVQHLFPAAEETGLKQIHIFNRLQDEYYLSS